MIKMVLVILASLLVGFTVGRRIGLAQGFRVGMAYGLLDARRRGLEDGYCPICDNRCLVTTSNHDQETAGTPNPHHDNGPTAAGEDGNATAKLGEFGRVIAGCCRQVLNLLMGAFSLSWKYTTEAKEAWMRLILPSSPKVRKQLALAWPRVRCKLLNVFNNCHRICSLR